MSNLNLLQGMVWAFILKLILVDTAPDSYYVPSTVAFYGYMLVAILSHDFLFYHGHR